MINVVSLSWDDEKELEERLYNEFVELRVGCKLPIIEVYRRLDLSYKSAMGIRIRKRFRDEYGEFRVKCNKNKGRGKYIYENYYGYCICKVINGKNLYFGCYDDLEVAKKVRDRLVECNWNKELLGSIVSEVERGS